jgi:ribonuclease H-related protein
MSKFYAVKIGKIPGIYTSWTECEKNVKGFPGAIYKRFSNKKEAEKFIKDDELSNMVATDLNTIEIYTDGSHKKHSLDNYIGFGAFCSYMEKEYKLSGDCDKEILLDYGISPLTKISNPTAEFLGFAEILKIISDFSKKNDLKNYTFIFKIDYQGVKNWINGSWKCKETYIKKIKQKCDLLLFEIPSQILIEYVPAHSGNKYNDQADELAKSKISINTFPLLFTEL